MSVTMSDDNHRDDDLLEMSRSELQEIIRQSRRENDRLINAVILRPKRTKGKAKQIRSIIHDLTNALYLIDVQAKED